jgi:Fic family protein
MHIFDYIAHETERQSGTIQEALGMYGALNYLRNLASEGHPIHEPTLLYLARCINGVKGYRQVPAVFNQGNPAVSADLVPNAMQRLSHAMLDVQNPGPVGEMTARILTKEFLEIHPFTDGNGRVASLMWNFLNRTLDNPDPMPYFFGEDNG